MPIISGRLVCHDAIIVSQRGRLFLVDFPFTNEGDACPSGDILGWTLLRPHVECGRAKGLKLELNYTPI